MNLLVTLQAFTLEFIENTVENTLFHNGTAVERLCSRIQGIRRRQLAPPSPSRGVPWSSTSGTLTVRQAGLESGRLCSRSM